MRTGRLRNIIYKGVAWLLTAVLLLSYAERLGGGVIDVQAKEDKAEGQDDGVYDDTMEYRNMLSLGYHHSAAIKNDGSLWTWGGNFNGGLGIGEESIPFRVSIPITYLYFPRTSVLYPEMYSPPNHNFSPPV